MRAFYDRYKAKHNERKVYMIKTTLELFKIVAETIHKKQERRKLTQGSCNCTAVNKA